MSDPDHPGAALFDVSGGPDCGPLDGMLERVALDQLELAPNPRRELDPEATERLALMLMRDGQLVPCIGRRSRPDGPVLLYDGQRRLLAARASHELAAGAGLRPVASLVVLLVDHEPTQDSCAACRRRPTGASRSRCRTSSASSTTAGRPGAACPRTSGSPPSAPISASPPARRTTCGAS